MTDTDATTAYRVMRFTARCYASAVLAMAQCPSVRPSVRPSQVGAKDLREIRPGSPHTGAPNAGGVSQNRRLSTNNWIYLEKDTR